MLSSFEGFLTFCRDVRVSLLFINAVIIVVTCVHQLPLLSSRAAVRLYLLVSQNAWFQTVACKRNTLP